MTHEHIPSTSTVYTPLLLAAAMVRAARGRKDGLWLDPCVGDGALVLEMAKLGVERGRILALDIAPNARAHDELAHTSRGVDFVEWAQERGDHVDHVVMNPPYVALSRVRDAPLTRALEVVLADGRPLPLKANYWCAFVVQALLCLREGGSLVAVLPAAWEYAKYAKRVRETVERAFGEVVVVRCASPLFSDVREGAVVIACYRRGHQPCTVRRTEVADLVGTVAALEEIARGTVPPGTTVLQGFKKCGAHVPLGDLVDIRIGAVTGDVHYFLLTEAKRLELGLPRSAVCPVLSRSGHLVNAIVGRREWETLRDNGARVWLFRPSRATLGHPAVKAYLGHGEAGGCNVGAFKVRSREPWHRTPIPRGIDGFLSGMSKRLPFLVLRDMKRLSATNTLYVVRFKRRETLAKKATLGLALLTTEVRAELGRRSRCYADGLLKFEPAELGSVPIPVVASRRDAPSVLRRATSLLLSGREQEASAIADAWFAADHPAPRLARQAL